MSPSVKKFRLNVFIAYWEGANINNFRYPLHQILKNLAWLYCLDYAIHQDTDLFDTSGLELSVTTDFVYLRSTDRTQITSKALRQVLKNIFDHSDLQHQGVDISHQFLKHLSEYPFPSEFHRPLNYPYIEFHKDAHSEIYIREEALKHLSDDN